MKLDQAQVDAQALNIAYCHIVSPVTGRIGLRLVDPGNYVQTSSPSSIAVVTQLQPITVIFTVPEDDLPDIMPQYNAGTALQVTAFDRANVKQLAIGKVSAVDSQIDTTTGTVKIRAQFDNCGRRAVSEPVRQRAAPGQDFDQRRHGADGCDPARLAERATGLLRLRGQIRQHRHVQPISIGPTDGSMTAVNTGLSAGDHVVIDGADRLREGLHVNVSTLDGKPPGRARRAGSGSSRTPRRAKSERPAFADPAQQQPIASAGGGSARARR